MLLKVVSVLDDADLSCGLKYLHQRMPRGLTLAQQKRIACLVAIACEQRQELPVIHRSGDGLFRDLEFVAVQNGQHGTALFRIDELRIKKGGLFQYAVFFWALRSSEWGSNGPCVRAMRLR